MIRQQIHLFNDSSFVLPVYGTTASSPPPGTLDRAYHRRLKIYADGVFVLPAYDTVGGTPGPATGTMAPRYHRGLSVHAGAWNEAIVLPAYGVQDTPTPPTGQVVQVPEPYGPARGWPLVRRRKCDKEHEYLCKEEQKLEKQLEKPTRTELQAKRAEERRASLELVKAKIAALQTQMDEDDFNDLMLIDELDDLED